MVGAGPGGMEAARVSAERGHQVVVLEKEPVTGGQVNIAALAPTRKSLSGITRWLDQQVRKLGVDLRLGTEATGETVLGEEPDCVVIATGGEPEEEREIDQVVAEHGTRPNEAIYFALKKRSANLGELDLDGMAAGAPQPIVNNPDGGFQLYRVGDALVSRNIHAAIYDSLRICKEF